jgi:hypothetical protein
MHCNRRTFFSGAAMAAVGHALCAPCARGGDSPKPDGEGDFEKRLRVAGIWDVAADIGLDADAVFLPLTERADHPYRLYRWSVSYAETGAPLIQALPPEEEMGWMPWEEWLRLDGRPVRRAMALFPVKDMKRKVPRWWCLERSEDLTPRRATPPPTMEALFERDRIFEAASAAGFDAARTLLAPLSPAARQAYLRMRWSLAPHRLAADLPVIQCLPPADKMDEWPWETWYTDGTVPLIHHVHVTKPNARTEPESWRERNGAPQRPAELFGRRWYWYNDEDMKPAMAGM